MAQSSLNSILRSAMELKAKIGNQEINIPAWIQDHITNSENFIDQASQGYHEYSNGGHEGEEMNEARVSQDNVINYLANALQSVWNAGKGNNSIDFQDFAQSLYFDMFGGDEMNETFQPKSSFDDYKIGDNITVAGKKAKITNMKMDDESGERRARVRFEDGTAEEVSINSLDESQLEEAMANRQNIAQIVAQKYGNQLNPILNKYKSSSAEWSTALSQYGSSSPEFKEINKAYSELSNGFKNMALNGAAKEMKAMGMSDTQIRNYFSEYGPFEDWVHDFMDELISELPQVSEQQNQNTMTTNEGRSAEDLKQGQLDQAYSHLEKIKEKPKLFSSEDIKKAEARIEKLEAELDALATKATNESLDEATVRRWQHYAGIK
jgi:hypothetical protein